MTIPTKTLREIDLNPLEVFAAQYMSHHLKRPVARFHRALFAALYDKSQLRIAIESWRGSGKSTLGSVIFPVYMICHGTEPEIQLFSVSGGPKGLATKWARRIKKEITRNELLVADYGLQKGETWTEDFFQVVRADGFAVDVYSRGKHAAARGSRGVVLIDDPQDIKEMDSEAILSADVEWFFSDVIPILLIDQRCIFIGTSMSPLSLLSKIKKLPGWTVLEYCVEEPPGSGRSAWPEQFPDDHLEWLRGTMGRDRYAAEYLCRPRVSGNPVFKEEWLLNYDPKSTAFDNDVRRGLYTVTGGDGAFSLKKKSDYTAIATVSATFDARPKFYVRDVRRDHWSMKDGAGQFFRVFDSYKQNKTVVEDLCAPPNKGPFVQEIEERERMEGIDLNLYWFKPNLDKKARAEMVQSLFQDGRVFFDHSDAGTQGLMDELIMFRGDGTFHDDRVDALVTALTELKEWAERRTPEPTTKAKPAHRRGKFTGLA